MDSLQLLLEKALKALIPYLQSLADPDGIWDFLDVFPFDPDPKKSFLFMAGHLAQSLPDDKTDFLSFISGLPQWLDARHRIGILAVRLEFSTGGIADEKTRNAATALHSQRIDAIISLFSRDYQRALTAALNKPAQGPDNRPWLGLGFTGWEPNKPEDGASPSGNEFIAKPSYVFECFREI